ncbi:lipase family protein [Sorangium sp. So ce448]|uniref:lipase family protein n=1 Tax=Sorangium sp. So ce448 TaxID=3133314 RepID=UPI003F610169
MFVDASIYLLQSKDCKTTILCFRGTEPRNAINWLSDLSARPESFLSAGKVHGGFHRTIRAMWPLLRPLLCSASKGESICKKLKAMDGQWLKRCPGTKVSGTQTQLQEPSPQEHPEASCDTQAANEPEFEPALYVAGHSLGGALAVLAAVLIDWDDDLHKKSNFLRGVYTYGQPMVGDYTFFREHREGVGQMVFRHVYGRDIVPRLPPLAMGCFWHIGREYRSSDAGWELQVWPVPHVLTLGLSNLVGVLAWFTQDVLPLHGLKLPLSWGHHSPMNYMRTSMMASPGAEFDPSAPAPTPEDG